MTSEEKTEVNKLLELYVDFYNTQDPFVQSSLGEKIRQKCKELGLDD